VRRLFLVSALPILVCGCSITSDRDVRAYNTCLARHPQDAVICEGPRQAYEVDPNIAEARSTGGGSGADYELAPPMPLVGDELRPSPL